jgi:hypothetical protein
MWFVYLLLIVAFAAIAYVYDKQVKLEKTPPVTTQEPPTQGGSTPAAQTGTVDVSFDKADNFFPAPAQIINSVIVHSSQSNGSYSIKLPAALDIWNACNAVPNTTFWCNIYPRFSATLRTGDGGVLYGGARGDVGGSGGTAFQTCQGGTSVLLPNNSAYALRFVSVSAASYYVFMSQ